MNYAICLGLAIIPFYELLLSLLVPHNFPVFMPDTRIGKEYIALGFMLASSLVVLFKDGIKPVQNKWLLIFVGFIFLSIFRAPDFILENGLRNFWMWQPAAYAIIILLFISVVASVDALNHDMIKNTIVGVGCAMAIYVFVQLAGLDPLFFVNDREDTKFLRAAALGGMLGQPTLVAPFIGMCIPFALVEGRWVISILMLTAVILTQSAVGVVATIAGVMVVLFFKSPRVFLALGIVCAGIFGFAIYKDRLNTGNEFFNSSGRLGIWKHIVKDIQEPPHAKTNKIHALTGFGPGSYRYVFVTKHQTEFVRAHNEYLEMIYNIGIIGFVLFGIFVWSLWSDLAGRIFYDDTVLALWASFIIIALAALGTFVWQLAAHMFYTAVILGSILNITRR